MLAYGQVINYETKIIIQNNGKKSTQRTILIQINCKDENWLSHIELLHNPSQDLSVNYANIQDLNGNIVRKIKKKDFITRNNLSYQSFYRDDLITEFDMYWNQYPYRIEYSYTVVEEEYLYVAWWTPLMFSNITTIKSSLEVMLPVDFDINIHSSGNARFNESVEDNRKVLIWQSNMVSKYQYEIFSPSTEKLIPIVKLVPISFDYGVPGKADSWSSFGLWLDKLNDGIDQLTIKEQQAVEKLASGINNRTEIIKAIYYYLQDQTKYVNVTIDVGGLKSYPATYVCENKYGDCKALTTYMKALLKSVGIESYYAIIKAGENDTEIDVNLPSQQFNHMILMVPSEQDTVWLENTSNALPFNYLGTFTQSRYALAINGEKSLLVKTPKLSIDDVLIERNYNFKVTSKQDVLVDLDLTLRGNSFERFRHLILQKDEELQIREINSQHGIKYFIIDRWNILDYHRDSVFLHLNITGTSSSILQKVGAFYVINPLNIKLPDFEKPNDRTLDVVINVPINRSDKSTYDLQSLNQKTFQIPDRIRIESQYGTYYADFWKNDNELIVEEKFTLYANTISMDKYESFYEFIKSINTYKKTTTILVK
jgi:transglutaminase-like putative cysteine protease